MQNMIALKAATQTHPPLHNIDMNHLQKATDITRTNNNENIKQLINQMVITN
jgi:hypothetical protein